MMRMIRMIEMIMISSYILDQKHGLDELLLVDAERTTQLPFRSRSEAQRSAASTIFRATKL